MKIKITDLLDSYYDESVKFTPARKSPEQAAPTPITAAKKQRFKKPLTAVACFILLACGTSLLGLRFLGGNQGTSLAQPEAPEISLEEPLMELEESSAEAPLEVEDSLQDEGIESTLDLSELPGEDQYQIDASEDSISLSNFIMYDTADENCSPIDHCTVGQAITLSFQIICKDNFSDSTILNIDYTLTDAQQNVIDTFSSESSFTGDLGSVIVHTSTLPGLTDTPGYYNLELQLTNELGQIFTAAIAYSVADPDTHYDPAQDTDGDGYLTAWLTYDTPIGTVVKLQLNVTENTFAWYIHNEELIDAYVAYEAGTGDWDTFDTLHIEVFNDLLNYFNNAYIVFTDGTKVPVGGGDSYRLEDDLFREESLITLTGTNQDYYPAYLEFDGTRYDFE